MSKSLSYQKDASPGGSQPVGNFSPSTPTPRIFRGKIEGGGGEIGTTNRQTYIVIWSAPFYTDLSLKTLVGRGGCGGCLGHGIKWSTVQGNMRTTVETFTFLFSSEDWRKD